MRSHIWTNGNTVEEENKKGVFLTVYQVIEDGLSLMGNIVEIARQNINFSIRKIIIGFSLLLIALTFLILTFVFLLISLAFIFVDLGLPNSLSFFIVSIIMISLSAIFTLISIRSFKKIKGIRDAIKLTKETNAYLKDNLFKS